MSRTKDAIMKALDAPETLTEAERAFVGDLDVLRREYGEPIAPDPCPFTFTYQGLFTVATDLGGHCYRVLLAFGGNPPVRYKLEPWSPEGRQTLHRGIWVTENYPWFAAIDAAEKARRWPSVALPSNRFEADFI